MPRMYLITSQCFVNGVAGSVHDLPDTSGFSKIEFWRSESFVAEYNMGHVRQRLTSKLRAAEGAGTRHDVFIFEDDDGVTLGRTRLSRGHDTVSMKNLGLMAGQLGIRLIEFRGAIDCRVSRAQFLDLLRNSLAP